MTDASIPGWPANVEQPDVAALAYFWREAWELLVVLNGRGVILAVSPGWERTLGWSRSDTLGRPWSDFVHPEDLERALSATRVGDLLLTDAESRYVCADGSFRWLRWTAERHDRRWYAIGRDITSQRWPIRVMRRAQQRFDAVWNLSDAGLMLLESSGRIVRVNDALCALLKVTHQELVGVDPPYPGLPAPPEPGQVMVALLRPPGATEALAVTMATLALDGGERMVRLVARDPTDR